MSKSRLDSYFDNYNIYVSGNSISRLESLEQHCDNVIRLIQYLKELVMQYEGY